MDPRFPVPRLLHSFGGRTALRLRRPYLAGHLSASAGVKSGMPILWELLAVLARTDRCVERV